MQQGWQVFASMRDTARGAVLMEEVQASDCAGGVRLVALDVTDEVSVTRGVEQVLCETGGTLDALVNNVGYGMIGAFEDVSRADCRKQMETNFFGALDVTRAVLPAMRAAGRRRIVVVTSNAVNSPHPMLTMYAASKWALEGWAEGLAMEVAPFGVEVVVVQPDAHRTPFASHVVPIMSEGSPYGRWMEAVGPNLASLNTWGRDPALATQTMVDAVNAPEMPFRTALGEDSQIFARLKGTFPYEMRAAVMRAILGIPSPCAYIGDAAAASSPSTGAEVVHRTAELCGSNPQLAQSLIEALLGKAV